MSLQYIYITIMIVITTQEIVKGLGQGSLRVLCRSNGYEQFGLGALEAGRVEPGESPRFTVMTSR